MEHLFKHLDIHAASTTGSVSIDCKDLIAHPHVQQKLPNLFDELSQKPENIISCLGNIVKFFKRFTSILIIFLLKFCSAESNM